MPSTHLWKPVLAEILSCNLLFLPSLFKHSHFTLCKLNVRKKPRKSKISVNIAITLLLFCIQIFLLQMGLLIERR